jgi:hypothetical protein
MKNLFAVLLVFKILVIWSQKEEIIHHHKFPNGKTSTICVIKDDRDGYAKAFNFKGEEIYMRHIRRYAGHASVYFTHHPNGMVKKAEYSSHPDAGIQWYRSYTYFDENGNITSQIEDDWDMRVTVPKHIYYDTTRHVNPSRPNQPQVPDSLRRTDPLSPELNPQPVKPQTTVVPTPVVIPEPIHNPQPPKPETVACASIHQNKTEFVNHSKHNILLSISHQGKDTIVMLKPGEKFNGPTYISAEIASPLAHNVRFQFNPRKKNVVIDKTTSSKALAQYETLHTVNFYGQRKVKEKKKK